MSKRLKKVGGGPPTPAAIGQFFAKVDNDESWFPGKLYGSKGGRPKALSPTNESVIARSAMAMKLRDEEPTADAVIAQTPRAACNPATGEAVDKKVIYEILSRLCHDGDPSKPWVHGARFAKNALSAIDLTKRWNWTVFMANLNHQAIWYFNRVIFTDICNSILPLTEKKAQEQRLTRKAKKGWRSEGSQLKNRNLKGPRESTTQASWGTRRVWWLPMLCQGKLHIEYIGENFHGDDPRSMQVFVQKLRAAVNVRFPAADKPKIVFTDKGRGFYDIATSKITPEYKEALTRYGFKAFAGDDASIQPGNLQEAMLHETAVSWIRTRLRETVPKRPWEETQDNYAKRLKLAAAYINENHEVANMNLELPSRVAAIAEAKGGRIRK